MTTYKRAVVALNAAMEAEWKAKEEYLTARKNLEYVQGLEDMAAVSWVRAREAVREARDRLDELVGKKGEP